MNHDQSNECEDVIYLAPERYVDESLLTMRGIGITRHYPQTLQRDYPTKMELQAIYDGAAVKACDKHNVRFASPKKPDNSLLFLASVFCALVCVFTFVMARPSVRALEDSSFVQGAGK